MPRTASHLRRPVLLAVVLAMLLAACGGSASDDGDAAAVTGGSGDEAAVLDITATTADGDTFTPGDFAGQPVLVETFATWCSNCRDQLGRTQEAAAQFGDDAVVLALSVETSLDPARLDTYAQDNGFGDIRFGVLDADGLAALKDRFGNSVLNPPSTPKFWVSPEGQVSDVTTGFESVDELLAVVDTTS